jgi:hypothetical protein
MPLLRSLIIFAVMFLQRCRAYGARKVATLKIGRKICGAIQKQGGINYFFFAFQENCQFQRGK